VTNSPQDEHASQDDEILAGFFARAEKEAIPAHPDYDPYAGLRRFLQQLGSEEEAAAPAETPQAGGGTGEPREFTVLKAENLAIRAHAGLNEMYGEPYHTHLRTVAEALAPYGPLLVMAGWLHDIQVMTAWTAQDLLEAGVPDRVVEIVELLTTTRGDTEAIRPITRDPEALLVKIADNADSIYPERDTPALTETQKREWLDDFEEDRRILWPAGRREDIETIVGAINPPLLQRMTME
jgi:(p)ppGpp synthase/HD superfamily hydrolase